jgi:hypothetical protein
MPSPFRTLFRRHGSKEVTTMSKTAKWLLVAAGAAVVAVGSTAAVALGRPRPSADAAPACRGPGMGHGGGHGADMRGIHFLFAHRNSIVRTVTEIPGGVRTLTEADDPAVTAQLQQHVEAMSARLKEGRPINARDPLFAALFRNADKIDVQIEKTTKGLRVTETSADPDVVTLIRRHAAVVGAFIANGMPEMMKGH